MTNMKVLSVTTVTIIFVLTNVLCYDWKNDDQVPILQVTDSKEVTTLFQVISDAKNGLRRPTDEDKIIRIIGRLFNEGRQDIKSEYRRLYDQDLVADLKEILSGNFNKTIQALLTERKVFLANEVNRALTANVTDDETLAEILCTRSRKELLPIMDTFEKRYNKTLLAQLDESLEGDKRTFYKEIITEKIREAFSDHVNMEDSLNQVNIIPDAEENCTVTENPELIRLLAKQSFNFIRSVAANYEKSTNKTIEDQLKRWCNDDGLTQAYITTVRFAKSRPKFFADELHSAIETEVNDVKVIRIVVSRSQKDLSVIDGEYNRMYGYTFYDSLEGKISGSYRKLLQKVIKTSYELYGHQSQMIMLFDFLKNQNPLYNSPY